eukprot:TRINITY_DN68004_c1_g1_i2.p1 TRINITY_DN68004_c1_g1~~TRINITY_DN68004_c1_g1_i2.p1  ORF type:complete len:520 (+),score=93.51 TRINITY_DN68004_c1_g1_i2:786-2345(+)
MEGERRDVKEREAQKKDKKRQEEAQKKNLGEFFQKINKLNDPEDTIKRGKLVMPPPQVSDKELRTIAKMGPAGVEQLQANATPQHTPQAADPVQLEAQNLARLQSGQTPLLGGENPQLNEKFDDFAGATPQRKVIQTPNVLAESATGATPRLTADGGQTPMGTPMRDSLKINQFDDTMSELSEKRAARENRRKQAEQKRSVKRGFDRLPAPENDFELSMRLGEEQQRLLTEPEKGYKASLPLDAEQRDQEVERAKRAREQAKWKRESQVVQRSLPRPTVVHKPASYDEENEGDVQDDPEDLLANEMYELMRYDNENQKKRGKKRKRGNAFEIEFFPDELMTEAKKLLTESMHEMQSQSKFYKFDEAKDKYVISDFDAYVEECEEVSKEILFLPNPPRYIPNRNASNNERLQAAAHAFEVAKHQLTTETDKAAKYEARVTTYTAGYQRVAEKHLKTVETAWEGVHQAQLEHKCFVNLREIEEQALAQRLFSLAALVDEQKEKERMLQARYKVLKEEEQGL